MASARSVVVVAFRDEKGRRVGRSCFGSRALRGLLEPDELDAVDNHGVSVREALARLGLPDPEASHRSREKHPAAFIELHIDQRPKLARAGVLLGYSRVDSRYQRVFRDV